MDSSGNPTRIVLVGEGRIDEARAAGTVKPGHLLIQNSSGNYIAHNDAGGRAEPVFAVEDALQGRTIGDNYASGELMQLHRAVPGDEIYAWLAAGESVNPSDVLSSAGDGTLQDVVSTDDWGVAVPTETVDNSESPSVAVRIKVRVI